MNTSGFRASPELKRGEPEAVKSYIQARISISPSGCWEWKLHKDTNGYAAGWIGRRRRMHRISYQAYRGAVPVGLTLDHLCRNKTCINPDHLEPVTIGENALRGVGPTAVNKRKTHCIRGHEFTAENTIYSQWQWRKCRACNRRAAA